MQSKGTFNCSAEPVFLDLSALDRRLLVIKEPIRANIYLGKTSWNILERLQWIWHWLMDEWRLLTSVILWHFLFINWQVKTSTDVSDIHNMSRCTIFCPYIHGSLRINPTDITDPVTFWCHFQTDIYTIFGQRQLNGLPWNVDIISWQHSFNHHH